MKAVVQDRYGSSEVLGIREVDPPEPGNRQVLVRVRAASVHPGDWLLMMGRPYMMRPGWGMRGPRKNIPGFDVAGHVVAVGDKVTEFHPGDEVFGSSKGSCAEYAVASENAITSKPQALTFEQAAAVTVSGVTALRGIRDRGKVQPGQQVLINGASGGIGTYAVQIAKALGAEVTGVCSGTNAEMVRSIGADHVIDYTQEDFTRGEARYDLILDNVANHSLSDYRRALNPAGKLLPNNGTAGGAWFGPLGRMLAAVALSPFIRRQGRPFVAIPTQDDLAALKEFIEADRVTPIIGRTYSLAETPAAMAQVGTGHAVGKVVITV